MTIAAVWQEEGLLWCVSDTRISRPGNSGLIITTDAGAKIYPLWILCRRIADVRDGAPFIFQPHFARRVGLVFAGNILIASQAIATISSLCQSLETLREGEFPSLENIGELLRKIVALYVADFRGALGDLATPNLIEVVLFGGCPINNELQIWSVRDEVVDGAFDVYLTRRPAAPGEVTAIGSQRERLMTLLNQPRQAPADEFRLPKRLVQQMANEGAGDVGGSITIAFASLEGFELHWTAAPDATRRMNGVDIEALGRIGPAMIGGRGMA
ncbi:hypothetical protein [Ensifer sp. 22564]|uniref:hypothetical protein n=1 Tax=Ensifer sp. 22564 TaxID=3453943 RepID=UPI003F8673FA